MMDRARQWVRTHHRAVDAAVAAAVAVVAVIAHFHQREVQDQVFRDPSWRTVPLVICTCLPLAFRRIYPIGTMLTIIVLQGISEIADINGTLWIPMLLGAYSLGAHAAGRKRVVGSLVGAVLLLFLLVGGLFEDEIGVAEVFGAAASVAVPWLVGDIFRRRRAELAELAERADHLEREREVLAGQRVADERTRIARELHDVVAHSVSAMVIQATAARRYLNRAPEATEGLLANIEETGRTTMAELRQILGLLRDADSTPSAEPLRTMDDIEALVGSANDLDVRLTTSGPLDGVPAGVAMSAFRVVQESLTNARRHAGPHALIEVRVDRLTDRLDICVEDDGRGASTLHEPGYGLVGMSERVAAFGGTLRSGPRRSGGWQVSASFPLSTTSSTTS